MINCIAFKFWFQAHLPQAILNRNTRTLRWQSPQKLEYAGRRRLFCQNTLIASVKVNWIWISSYGFSFYCCMHDKDSVTPVTPATSLLIFNTPATLSVLVKLCHTVQDSKDPVCLSVCRSAQCSARLLHTASFVHRTGWPVVLKMFSNPHYVQRSSHKKSLFLGRNWARFISACPAWDGKTCPGDVTC